MSNYHTSVLLDEAVSALQVHEGAWYVDATLGGGGHTIAIARKGGSVIAFDIDEDAIAEVTKKLQTLEPEVAARMRLVQSNFTKIPEVLAEQGIETVAGVLFDLGVSSYQFDTAERGFSIRNAGSLDMRMDKSLTVTAKDLVNGLTKHELITLFEKYGEERYARRIADAIVQKRTEAPIETTDVLALIIERTVGRAPGKIHPATRIFQALRIAVNDELHALSEAIDKSFSVVKVGGRLVIISFHSLEDRIVKRAFLSIERAGRGIVITKKPIRPGDRERETNPRSESAKLRIIEKII